MATAERLKYSLEQYLDFENNSQERHEYFRGEIFLMTGGSRRRGRIIGNLYYHSRREMEGTPCEPHISDQRVAVKDAQLHTYPDMAVVCGPIEYHPVDHNAIVNPSILFEVLSPTTERYDRGKKFELYRHIDSLREYILISQDEPLVEQFVRLEDGTWNLSEIRGLSAMLELSAVRCKLPLKLIYENVDFAPETPVDAAPPIQVQTERLSE